MKRFLAWVLPLLLLCCLFAGCDMDGDAAANLLTDVLRAVLAQNTEKTGDDALPALPTVAPETDESDPALPETDAPAYGEDCSDPDTVAAYLHAYGELPPNYLKKSAARALGWDSSRGNLWEVAEGKSIGGDRFGNYEGGLPDKPDRVWYECDVNYAGGYRGAERILYSSDGLIYYTDDHYKTFTLLYGEE